MAVTEEVKGVRQYDAGKFSVVVVKEFENRVVGRVEVDGYVFHSGKGTPSRVEVKEALSKMYNRDTSLVVIRRLETEFGWGRSRLEAHLYNSREVLFKYEPKYILRRDGFLKSEGGEGGK